MNDINLRTIFRRALSVTAPLLAAGVCGACGGSTTTSANSDQDASRLDAQPASDGSLATSPRDAMGIDAGAVDAFGSDSAAVDASLDVGACSNDASVPFGNVCDFYAAVPCDFPADAGDLNPTDCPTLCGVQFAPFCSVVQTASGRFIHCFTCAVGRRPEGFVCEYVADAEDRATSLGRFFATVATLEAASIDAFCILRDELEAHGAPASLVRFAEEAARDEERHARVMGKFATKFGSLPAPRAITRRSVRSLEQIALENAVEGCVRETFGALTGTWQAAHATDADVRIAMRAIAEDETRHAELSWAIDAWARANLSEDANARIDEARRNAARELGEELRIEPPMALVGAAGLPPAAAARSLWNALDTELWA